MHLSDNPTLLPSNKKTLRSNWQHMVQLDPLDFEAPVSYPSPHISNYMSCYIYLPDPTHLTAPFWSSLIR